MSTLRLQHVPCSMSSCRPPPSPTRSEALVRLTWQHPSQAGQRYGGLTHKGPRLKVSWLHHLISAQTWVLYYCKYFQILLAVQKGSIYLINIILLPNLYLFISNLKTWRHFCGWSAKWTDSASKHFIYKDFFCSKKENTFSEIVKKIYRKVPHLEFIRNRTSVFCLLLVKS